MGPQGIELGFVTAQPTPQQLVAEAERLGGMGIDIHAQTESGLTVAFSAFPKGRVNISTSAQNCLFIVDCSLVAPVLLQLLFVAGVNLGGHSNAMLPNPSLQLPLTHDVIRKASRQVQFVSVLALIPFLAVAVVLVISFFWLLARYAF